MTAGVEGNTRLTSVTGMVLLVLLAVEGVTVVSVGPLISLHIFLGVLLVGPVLLKCAATMYRFGRYYRGTRPYLDKGPPHIVLRILGPLVILTSLAVLGTGVGLIYTGPNHRQPLLTLHQASFIIWFGAMTIHVLGHVLEAGQSTWQELRERRTPVRRRGWRAAAVAASLAAGLGLALALYPFAQPWTSNHRNEPGPHAQIQNGTTRR